jgi:hypothetical protein
MSPLWSNFKKHVDNLLIIHFRLLTFTGTQQRIPARSAEYSQCLVAFLCCPFKAPKSYATRDPCSMLLSAAVLHLILRAQSDQDRLSRRITY